MKNSKASSQLKEFVKKHGLILAILALLPIAAVIIYCIVFKNELLNAGAWGSIIAGLFTYWGTITLGVFTFFHTWQQEKFQSSLQEIRVEIELHATSRNDCFVPYSEDELELNYKLPYKYEHREHYATAGEEIETWNFIGFTVKNLNRFINFDIEIVGIFFVNHENELQEVRNRFKIWVSSHPAPIDYKQSFTYFVGCDAQLLSKEYFKKQNRINWFVVFSMTDSNMKMKYAICEYDLGEYFGINKSIISAKEYQKRVKENGTPIIMTSQNRTALSR